MLLLLLLLYYVSAAIADVNLNQSEMVTKQQEIASSSDHPAVDWSTSQILPQLNLTTEEISSNISGFSPGKQAFVEQQQQEQWRVIGGREAKPHTWPWQVSIQFANMPFCGGAIYKNQWVLSATHCFLRYNKAFWKVVVGKHDLENFEASQQVFKVIKIIHHKDFNRLTKENDVSLLKLDKPIIYNDWVQPIKVCMGPLPKKCTITGWGATNENGNRVPRLHAVSVSILPQWTCNRYYKGRVTDNMLCAGKEAGGLDACQGDSGGPLSCNIGNGYQLAGLVSWGVGCGRPRRPGVYIRLGKYVDWINDVIAKEEMYADATDIDVVTCGKTAGQAPPPSLPLVKLSLQMSAKHVLSLEKPVLYARVSGVGPADPNSWPWQVSLQVNGRHLCSGVLLQDHWVLTARHCKVRPNWDMVVVGRTDLSMQSTLPILIDKIFHLPLEPNSTVYPDLALVHLVYPARLNSGVTHICLPDEDEEPNDSWSCVTTGWGHVRAAVSLNAQQLHQVGLSLVNYTTCNAQWNPGIVQEAHICSHAGGSSSCLGDPGAPLFCRKNGTYFLFGILSMGSSWCGDDKPAIFTSVSDFKYWISNVTGAT